jgi:hypothetical protein
MRPWSAVAALAAACMLVPGLRAQTIADSTATTSVADTTGTMPVADTTATTPAVEGGGAAGPRLAALAPSFADSTAVPADTGESRPHAVEYSNAYGTRLAIHRYASYAELPLFAAEYALGQSLLNAQHAGEPVSSSTRSAHAAVAGALGALFAVNTVTGVWNLIEARHDPAGRTRRTIHGLGMLLADAGFLYTASLAGDAGEHGEFGEPGGQPGEHEGNATAHRNAAIASMGVATAATLMMWLWKD